MYYVDSYSRELVKKKYEFASPERYYEYRRGINEGIIIETYVVSYHPLCVKDFTHKTSDQPGFSLALLEMEREHFFKKYDISPSRAILYAYTVPPSVYDKKISEIEEEC